MWITRPPADTSTPVNRDANTTNVAAKEEGAPGKSQGEAAAAAEIRQR